VKKTKPKQRQTCEFSPNNTFFEKNVFFFFFVLFCCLIGEVKEKTLSCVGTAVVLLSVGLIVAKISQVIDNRFNKNGIAARWIFA
jgi:hypothetical protein